MRTNEWFARALGLLDQETPMPEPVWHDHDQAHVVLIMRSGGMVPLAMSAEGARKLGYKYPLPANDCFDFSMAVRCPIPLNGASGPLGEVARFVKTAVVDEQHRCVYVQRW